MKDVFKSSLNKSEEDYILVLEELLNSNITKKEQEVLNFYIKSYNDLGVTPTELALLSKFPELTPMLAQATQLELTDLEYHAKTVIRDRKSMKASQSLMDIASKIQDKGLTEDDIESLRDLVDTTEVEVNREAYDFSYFKEKYEKSKDLPTGLLTYVQEVDDLIGGMTAGSFNVIAAYTSQFKSTWCNNIAYNNAYHMGYNVVIISLEVPKEHVLMNILSRHSADPKFTKFEFVGHEKIRKAILTKEEEEFVFQEVLPDFMDNSKGKLFILDETDFANMSFAEIRNTLYSIDDICVEQTGTHLDAVIVDYAQLLKYTDNGSKGKSEMAIVGEYVNFFRRLSVNFRKIEDGTYAQLCVIMPAQTNRQGWEKASKKRGAYLLNALAEVNELEKSAYRVFSIWTDDLLKESKEAMVCVLKNRSGQTQYNPIPVYVDGEAYVFGDALTPGQGTDTIDFNSDSFDLESMFNDSDLGFLD